MQHSGGQGRWVHCIQEAGRPCCAEEPPVGLGSQTAPTLWLPCAVWTAMSVTGATAATFIAYILPG